MYAHLCVLKRLLGAVLSTSSGCPVRVPRRLFFHHFLLRHGPLLFAPPFRSATTTHPPLQPSSTRRASHLRKAPRTRQLTWYWDKVRLQVPGTHSEEMQRDYRDLVNQCPPKLCNRNPTTRNSKLAIKVLRVVFLALYVTCVVVTLALMLRLYLPTLCCTCACPVAAQTLRPFDRSEAARERDIALHCWRGLGQAYLGLGRVSLRWDGVRARGGFARNRIQCIWRHAYHPPLSSRLWEGIT